MSEDINELFQKISAVLCNNIQNLSPEECYKHHNHSNSPCENYENCKISEKTREQLEYVVHSHSEHSFLKACPGSGKTEVVGLKSAYEIKKWDKKTTGISVLTYTNEATNVIIERVLQFTGTSGISFPHYIGTIDRWLHGYILNPFAYKVTGYIGDNDDRSVHIIENISDAPFLKNPKFLTKFPFFMTPPVQANQFYFRDKNCISISFRSEDIYNDFKRNSNSLNNGMKIELKRIKEELWKSGFATLQDVEIICYKILKENPNICKLISDRFKIIIVDECQDLSILKIEIFKLLKQTGTAFHLVGDLNQSIFFYNNADINNIYQFTTEGTCKEFSLTKNFRSVQSIVNTCSKIVKNEEIIKGQIDEPGKNYCVIFKYKKDAMHEIPEKFIDYLVKNNYSVENSAILVRNHDNINKIITGQTTIETTHRKLPPTAIYLWNNNEVAYKVEAFSLIGRFLSKNLCSELKVNYRNFYCPNNISNYQWRFFLSDILEDCHKLEQLSDLTIKWSKWRSNFDELFPKILKKYLIKYSWLNLEEKIKTAQIGMSPQNEKDKPVIETINQIKGQSEQKIQISTIHSAKGKTYEAILLVSTPYHPAKKETGSGYWEQWLDIDDANGESARFAYVASSRPKCLLAWAISEKDYNEWKKIEKLKTLGFSPVDPFGVMRKKINENRKKLNENQKKLFDFSTEIQY
jgi:DNA helicase-2/ATP-dependent DNA helicase PcrA